MRSKLLLLFGFSVALGGRLEELCLGDGGSILPDLSLADLGLRFQMDHEDVVAIQNLTESALYPLHVVGGEYQEAMIRVHGPGKESVVNLEPGHAGVECRTMNKGHHDATIWVTMEPSASYVQLLSLGSVTVDVWVSVNSTHLGYDRYSFDVVADEEEVALVAALRENEAEDTVVDSVVLPADDIPTPSPSRSNETIVEGAVVLPAATTPTPSQSPSSLSLTFPPTSTSIPTVTGSPTYNEPCHICGDASSKVTKTDGLASILGLAVSCGVLQSWADDNLLSLDTCSVAIQSVGENCDCKPMEDSPAPSALLTFPPTSTMLPTITAFPTYGTKCIFDTESHCFDGEASMNMLGLAYSCKAIVEQGAQGLLAPSTCSVAKEAFERGDCACAPTSSPATRLPTGSPVPTQTALPTYSESCDICMGDDDLTIEVFNQVISCGELRTFGQAQLIDPLLCSEAQRIAETTCGCPIDSVEATSPSPSIASVSTEGGKTASASERSPSSNAMGGPSHAYFGIGTGLCVLFVFLFDA